MFPDLGANTPPTMLVYLLLAGLLIAAVIGRRMSLVRTLTTLVIWGILGGLVVMLVRDRGRFDPYLTKVAGFLQADKQEVVGKEVRIRMANDGHFWVHARIGGVERRMLVDSGATVTALSADTAAEAGIEVEDSAFPIVLRTANGTVDAQTGTVPELRFGTIVARDLAVVISPAFGDTDVIGMNFLSRLKSWRVEGKTLILEPNHPQPVKPDTA